MLFGTKATGYRRISDNLNPRHPMSIFMANTTDMTHRMATSLGMSMLRKMAVRLSVGVRCYLKSL